MNLSAKKKTIHPKEKVINIPKDLIIKNSSKLSNQVHSSLYPFSLYKKKPSKNVNFSELCDTIHSDVKPDEKIPKSPIISKVISFSKKKNVNIFTREQKVPNSNLIYKRKKSKDCNEVGRKKKIKPTADIKPIKIEQPKVSINTIPIHNIAVNNFNTNTYKDSIIEINTFINNNNDTTPLSTNRTDTSSSKLKINKEILNNDHFISILRKNINRIKSSNEYTISSYKEKKYPQMIPNTIATTVETPKTNYNKSALIPYHTSVKTDIDNGNEYNYYIYSQVLNSTNSLNTDVGSSSHRHGNTDYYLESNSSRNVPTRNSQSDLNYKDNNFNSVGLQRQSAKKYNLIYDYDKISKELYSEINNRKMTTSNSYVCHRKNNSMNLRSNDFMKDYYSHRKESDATYEVNSNRSKQSDYYYELKNKVLNTTREKTIKEPNEYEKMFFGLRSLK